MSYINYLNLPSIPLHLLESPVDILSKQRITTVTDKNFFQIREANADLITWCNDNIKDIPFNFKAQYQIIGAGIPIHRDRALPNGEPRTIAFNYLLDTGGEGIETKIFSDEYELLETKIIEPFRWHSIKVNMLHGVFGLSTVNYRIALTLAPSG